MRENQGLVHLLEEHFPSSGLLYLPLKRGLGLRGQAELSSVITQHRQKPLVFPPRLLPLSINQLGKRNLSHIVPFGLPFTCLS